jgi:zinc protease
LFLEVLLDPAFSVLEVEHARRITEDSIKGMEDHTSQLTSKLFLENLFENHPYGKITIGTLESISKIGSDELKKLHRSWIQPKRLVISVSGALNRSDLDQWLSQIDKSLSAKSNDAGETIQIADEKSLKAPRWVEKSLGREQAHILVGGLGTTLKSDDRYAIRILNNILGGQSGRLFIELREKKSLAYSVAPMSFEGIERGYVAGYIACAINKRKEALQGMTAVLEVLEKKGPSEKEMKRAREFYLGRRAMDLQSDSSLASNYGLEALYGVDLKDDAELNRIINRVTAKNIQKVCRDYFLEPHLVTSVVG